MVTILDTTAIGLMDTEAMVMVIMVREKLNQVIIMVTVPIMVTDHMDTEAMVMDTMEREKLSQFMDIMDMDMDIMAAIDLMDTEATDMATMERERLSQFMEITDIMDIMAMVMVTDPMDIEAMVMDTMDKPKFQIQSVLRSESEQKVVILKILNKKLLYHL